MEPLLQQSQPILAPLSQAGYTAYLVGGAVRDALMGCPCHDLDVTTSATPEEVKAVFSHLSVIETGIAHGTVTVLFPLGGVEITTFRTETGYADHRRPDSVSYSTSLDDDLSRRDFTMNAIALGFDGIHDPFGGQQDIENHIIRCVGNPNLRFQEDALRMLRGLRFAATLGFQIETATAEAIHQNAHLLSHVSAERIATELIKLLCGQYVGKILTDFPDVMTIIIPELTPSLGFDQRTHYHSYDIYHHVVRTVEWVSPTPVLRLAALLHDIAKPQSFSLDEHGVGHFFGHAIEGAVVAEEILRRLKLSNQIINQVIPLVKLHGLTRDTPLNKLPRLISKLGEEGFFNLLDLDRADSCAKHPHSSPEDGNWDEIYCVAREFLDTKPCLTLGDLTVNGNDAMAVGLSGRQIGQALNQLLSEIIDGKLENQRGILLKKLENF